MKYAVALMLVGVAAMVVGCAPSNSLQNLTTSALNGGRQVDATKSERWNFLCVDNPMQGNAKYESTFKDLYGISLEGYCKTGR